MHLASQNSRTNLIFSEQPRPASETSCYQNLTEASPTLCKSVAVVASWLDSKGSARCGPDFGLQHLILACVPWHQKMPKTSGCLPRCSECVSRNSDNNVSFCKIPAKKIGRETTPTMVFSIEVITLKWFGLGSFIWLNGRKQRYLQRFFRSC